MEETTEKQEVKLEPSNIIKGSINYTIKEFDNGGWEVEYESSTDNDLAAIAIAQDLCEVIVAQISATKKEITNKVLRKHQNKIIEKGVSARNGLKAIADYLQPIFAEFKKSIAKQEKLNEDEVNI